MGTQTESDNMYSISINTAPLQIFPLFFSDHRKEVAIIKSHHSHLNEAREGLQQHILIADDDPDDIELFHEALTEIAPNIKISSVTDGNEVLKFLKKQQPDLVFLDLNMPRKNGIECLEEIRSVKAFKNLPVIIYSTTANAAQIEASFNKGASLYLQKPSHFEGIKKSIIKILSTGISSLFEQPSKANFFLSLK